MDIEFLLWLQDLRISLGSDVENAIAAVSDLVGVMSLVALCLVAYWCFDKRTGMFAILSFGIGNFINQFVKCIACVYRPWVANSLIEPAQGALAGATGYSFPSGHTVSAGTVLGAFAWALRKKHGAVAVLLVVLVALLAFGRMFLGVHTPQDVLVGLAESIIVVLACSRFSAWLEDHREHDAKVLAAALLLAAIVLVVVTVKPYPMDYVAGVLLVDPVVMQKDCYEGIGLFAGLFVGWYCERRWVNFTTAGLDWKARAVRLLIGLAFVALIMLGLDPLLKMVLDARWAKLASRLLVAFCALFVAPLLFTKIPITRGSGLRDDDDDQLPDE